MLASLNLSLRMLNWNFVIAFLSATVCHSVVAQTPAVSNPNQGTDGVKAAIDIANPKDESGKAVPETNKSRPIPPITSNAKQLQNSSLNRQVSQLGTSPPKKSSFSSLSNVPYMVGDTTAGGGGTLQIGGISNGEGSIRPQPGAPSSPSVQVDHPGFGRGRLNIAENNSPIVADRVYVNYRHFHNASEIDVFSYAPIGGQNSLDINIFTFGLERRLTENSSLDVRLPINSQLASDLNISQTTGPVTSFPLNDTDVSVGNLGLIYKLAFYQTENWYWSAGAALNLPTAPNVNIRTNIDDDRFQRYGPAGNPVGTDFPFRFSMNTRLSNDTVNLTPFLASVFRPSSSTYCMTFLQLDVPLNQSRINASGNAFVDNQPISAFNLQGRIDQQILIRANLAAGKWLWQNDRNRIVNSFGFQGEMHYTSSLNDADIVGSTAPNLANGSEFLRYGNFANRIDLLNTLVGVQTIIRQTAITNGFVVPLRTGPDRMCDYEYSLFMNRRF